MHEIDRGDHIVALAVDWHGDTDWAIHALELVAEAGIRTVHHLGDFGIYVHRGGRTFLDAVADAAVRLDIEIWVTPGNHEDWEHLDSLFSAEPNKPAALRPRLATLPRGYRWSHHGRSFVSVGGAPSIDFEGRIEGETWWRSELMTVEQAESIAAAGHADVLLSHDSSNSAASAVASIIGSNRRGWSSEAVGYASTGRELMDRVVQAVQPSLHAHGHYHARSDDQIGQMRVLSVNCNGSQRNLVLIDLGAEDFDVQWLSTTPKEGSHEYERRRVREARADDAWSRFYIDGGQS